MDRCHLCFSSLCSLLFWTYWRVCADMTAPRLWLSVSIRKTPAPVAVHPLAMVDLFSAQSSAALRAAGYRAHAAVSGWPCIAFSMKAISRSYVFTVKPAPPRMRLKTVLSFTAFRPIVASLISVRRVHRSAVLMSFARSSCSIPLQYVFFRIRKADFYEWTKFSVLIGFGHDSD